MLAYQRTYEKILEDLRNDVYPVNSLLPPEPKLEEIYNVSRTTVRRAIAQLADEGYVKVKQGCGTVVLKNIYPDDSFAFSRLRHFEDIISVRHASIPDPQHMTARGMYVDLVEADVKAAEALCIEIGTPVYRLQRIFYSRDIPLMYLFDYVRTDFFPQLDKYTNEFWDLYPFLIKKYGIQYKGCVEYISAAAADLVDSQILHIEPGTPLLKTRRVAQCDRGPLEYAVLHVRTDVTELCITMGDNIPFDSTN